ncbi:hypothetical protein WP1_156 [Pseudomonas phage WP1]
MEPKKPSPVDGVVMTSLDVLRKAKPEAQDEYALSNVRNGDPPEAAAIPR